jgi:hypothetical protein
MPDSSPSVTSMPQWAGSLVAVLVVIGQTLVHV